MTVEMNSNSYDLKKMQDALQLMKNANNVRKMNFGLMSSEPAAIPQGDKPLDASRNNYVNAVLDASATLAQWLDDTDGEVAGQYKHLLKHLPDFMYEQPANQLEIDLLGRYLSEKEFANPLSAEEKELIAHHLEPEIDSAPGLNEALKPRQKPKIQFKDTALQPDPDFISRFDKTLEDMLEIVAYSIKVFENNQVPSAEETAKIKGLLESQLLRDANNKAYLRSTLDYQLKDEMRGGSVFERSLHKFALLCGCDCLNAVLGRLEPQVNPNYTPQNRLTLQSKL